MSRTRSRSALAVAALAVCAAACAAPAAAPGPAPAPADDALTQSGPAALGGFAALPQGGVPTSELLSRAPECVPRSGPPYQLGVVGSFSGGGLTLVDGVSVTSISGRFCGVATVVEPPPERPEAKVCAALTAPARGLQFDELQTTLTLIPTVRTVVGNVSVQPETFTAFICDDQQPGPIAIETTIRASAVPGLFGTACEVGPLSATVRGSLTGELRQARASLRSDPFPVDAVQPSALCPSGLATNTNEILGLPLQASVSGLSLEVTAAIYRAPDPPA